MVLALQQISAIIEKHIFSGPVQVRVSFFPVRVVRSGLGSIFSGLVRSGFEKKYGPGFHLRSGFHFQYVLFINGLVRGN